MAEQTIKITDPRQMPILFGPQDQFLRFLRKELQVDIIYRNGELRVVGEADAVQMTADVFEQLQTRLERRGMLSWQDVERAYLRVTGQLSPEPEEDSPHSAENSESVAVEEYPAESSTELAESTQSKNFGPAVELYEKNRKIFARSEGQRDYIDAIFKHDLVFSAGPAGCGKTYLAVATAINALRRERVRKIVLVRPAVEAGEKLGFLPGDMLAKVNPFLRPLLDALNEMLDYEQVKRYMENDVIEIVPLAFMRGRTLNQTFMILDEAQNTTITQMKMFLTRMGSGSKIVVTGDTTQIDLPADVSCGLTDAINRLSPIKGVASVKLTGQDIVRHRLVREIVQAYDDGIRSPRTTP